MTNPNSFEDGALYADTHGDIWRAITDGTEFLHVKRANENTPDPTSYRWCEDAESIAKSFGPMLFITERLAPEHEALLLFALQEKNVHDDDVRHRALGLLDGVRAAAVAEVKAERAVRGPLHVDATPLMVTCDVEPLVEANVGEILGLLSGKFYDDFREIADAEPTGDHDGHAPERLAVEQLTAQLVERLATRVSLTGPEAVRVAGRMAELARPLAARSAHTAAVVMRTQQQRKGAAA